jgi:hypothetical protein
MSDDTDSAYNRWSQTEAGQEAIAEDLAIEDWIEAGEPSQRQMWDELQGRKQPDDSALTVKQAAIRQSRSTRHIYRQLPALQAQDPPGAYKDGRNWRILPSGLDALTGISTTEPIEPAGRGKRKKSPKRSATRWEA